MNARHYGGKPEQVHMQNRSSCIHDCHQNVTKHSAASSHRISLKAYKRKSTPQEL